MIKRKLLAVLLSFGLVFSNVLFINASETKRLVDTKVETKKDVYTDLTKEKTKGTHVSFLMSKSLSIYLILMYNLIG